MKPITSPFSDKILSVKKRIEKIPFRKEEFEVVYHYYEDEGYQFTTDETDEINLKQAYNQYREKHNLPFPDDIREIREKYQISAPKMAEVLGFGINVYRQYESGEIPSQSNARLIEVAKDPNQFKEWVLKTNAFTTKESEKLLKRISFLIEEQRENQLKNYLENYILGSTTTPNIFNGYQRPNLAKTIQVVCHLISKLKPTKTGLNKLLFYTDFLHFRDNGISLIGLEYRAAPFGTVPSRFDSLLEYFAENHYLNRHQKISQNGNQVETYSLGERFQSATSIFTEEETKTLNTIINLFKGKSVSEIVEINHKETAWIDNQEKCKVVDYRYAFELRGV